MNGSFPLFFFLFFFWQTRWRRIELSFVCVCVCFFCNFWAIVQALMGIKASLKDPHGAMKNWDQDSVDPCSWTMVTCSPANLVVSL